LELSLKELPDAISNDYTKFNYRGSLQQKSNPIRLIIGFAVFNAAM